VVTEVILGKHIPGQFPSKLTGVSGCSRGVPGVFQVSLGRVCSDNIACVPGRGGGVLTVCGVGWTYLQ